MVVKKFAKKAVKKITGRSTRKAVSKRRAKLMQDERWQKMLPELRKFIIAQKTQILIPAPFAKIPKID